MRIRRLALPTALLALLATSPAAWAAASQQVAQNRFAADAQGERFVFSPMTAGASTVVGTVSAQRLGVASTAGPGAVARAAVNRYQALLGLTDARGQLRYAVATTDSLGATHVQFEQVAGGVPVYASRVTVHLDAANALTAMTAGVASSTAGAAASPSVGASDARTVALAQVPDAKVIQEPALVVYAGVPFGSHPATLAWAVDVTSTSQADRQMVFVDAASGRVTDALDRTEFAKLRTIYNANHTTTTGTFARGEGDPATGNRDVDNAYDFTGATYDYYLSVFGRDSYDNAGAELVSFVHYGTNYQNAFWDGAEMVYGDGFAVNDVTAHELTHAVTERTAGLQYSKQSGALNESISDQAGWDVDPGDTTMGEDLPIGAIRDMENPGAFGQPATASQYVCTTSDNGGVHTNSGIPNKVYANLVDTMGRSAAERIRYRAQTVYLGPTATFADARAAEQQSAGDLGLSSTAAANAWQVQGVTATWQPPC
jgi:Zn-dependent metalloprotease